MIIKDYKCKCGHDDFFFADKGGQKGIYCSYCGRWFKWANKDEQNLRMKPYEPQEEKQLTKIADVVEGTIDHIDYDEAMDMLYDIKDILKDYERR